MSNGEFWMRTFDCKLPGSGSMSARILASEAQVGKTFALKIVNENKVGSFANPHKKESKATGAGSLSLDFDDEVTLLLLRAEQLTVLLKTCQKALCLQNGTAVSCAVLCQWLMTRFLCDGSLRQPNMVPVGKPKPKNVTRTAEFLVQWDVSSSAYVRTLSWALVIISS